MRSLRADLASAGSPDVFGPATSNADMQQAEPQNLGKVALGPSKHMHLCRRLGPRGRLSLFGPDLGVKRTFILCVTMRPKSRNLGSSCGRQPVFPLLTSAKGENTRPIVGLSYPQDER